MSGQHLKVQGPSPTLCDELCLQCSRYCRDSQIQEKKSIHIHRNTSIIDFFLFGEHADKLDEIELFEEWEWGE